MTDDKQQPCPDCGGTGKFTGDPAFNPSGEVLGPCRRCAGKGRVQVTKIERVCPACRCIRSCAPDLSREDAIAFGAICGLVEASTNKVSVADLCEDHRHKLVLLRSVGTFDRPKSAS